MGGDSAEWGPIIISIDSSSLSSLSESGDLEELHCGRLLERKFDALLYCQAVPASTVVESIFLTSTSLLHTFIAACCTLHALQHLGSYTPPTFLSLIAPIPPLYLLSFATHSLIPQLVIYHPSFYFKHSKTRAYGVGDALISSSAAGPLTGRPQPAAGSQSTAARREPTSYLHLPLLRLHS